MKTASFIIASLIVFVSFFGGCAKDLCSHDYLGVVLTYPTCEEGGTKSFKCTLCDDEYIAELPELWHDRGVDGKCNRCGVAMAIDEVLFELFVDGTFYFVAGVSDPYYHNVDLVLPATINDVPVKTVGENAFANSYFKSIKLPPTIEFIRKGAFSETYGLRSVTLSKNLKEIGEDAFLNSFVETVTLFANVVEIKQNAFSGCLLLHEVNFYGTQAQFEKIKIAEGNECFTTAKINFIS